AAVMGGLMYAIDSGVRLEGSDFVDGASAIGGGVSIQGGTLDMANVTVVDCVAVGQGGGLFIADATANLATASVRRCEAADGGGLWAQGGGVDVTNSRFQHNDAGNSGGGIVSVDEAVSLLSTEVCGNSPEQVFGTFVDLGENVIQAQCPCESDFDGNGEVDINDLLVVVSSWGACEPGCVGDTNGDDIVDTDDLLTVISAWGVCH
ncbi:MAG: hypothetical protein QF438_02065, partial [Phycisphaerales bacterium]|nr:hypothetical protein [Phycisphaerales bacterium]